MGSGALGGRNSTSPTRGQGLALKRRRTASDELPPLAQRARGAPAPPAAAQQQPLAEQLALLQRLLEPSASLPAAAPATSVLPLQPAHQAVPQLPAQLDTDAILKLLLQDPAAPAGPAGAAALAAALAPASATALGAAQAAPAASGARTAAALASGSPRSGGTTETLMSLLGFLAHKGASSRSPGSQP